MTEKSLESFVPWSQIEDSLPTFTSTVGGFSGARRGIVTTPDNKKLFVKIGTDEQTKGWAKKEIESYAFLEEKGFSYIPRLLSTNADNTGFAVDALLPEEGWDWTDTWSRERLDATLRAMDTLALMKPDSKYAELLKPVISDADNGWPKLLASAEQQAFLATKLATSPDRKVLEELQAQTEKASSYVIHHDTLVHDDVRADNCPWNKQTGEVKLVDWNWLELGDRRLDLAAFLVHVHQSGFDVLPNYADRLDSAALQWMAGLWLEAASKPIWPGGPEKLRDMQLRSGLTALRLSREIGA